MNHPIRLISSIYHHGLQSHAHTHISNMLSIAGTVLIKVTMGSKCPEIEPDARCVWTTNGENKMGVNGWHSMTLMESLIISFSCSTSK